MITNLIKLLLKPLMNERGWIGGGGGGYTERGKNPEEIEYERLRNELLKKRRMYLDATFNPRAFGYNENITDTTQQIDNPRIAELKNEIANEEFIGDPKGSRLTSLKNELANTPLKITTGGKTSTFARMTDAERITYDPNYAAQIQAQRDFDAGLSQVGTEIGKMDVDIQDLISKYNQFDVDTKNEILKLTGYTDEQATLLSGEINRLRPLQTQAIGLTQKAGLTLDDLMSGRIPENLKPYYTEAMEAEKERLGRMGVSRDARLEGITRAGMKTAYDFMQPYQNIYSANTNIARGYTSDIAGFGQTNLANRMGLSDVAMKYRTQGTQNWGNIPVLRGNIATQRMGLTNAYGQRASYYNQLQQQERDNLSRLANWYGQ